MGSACRRIYTLCQQTSPKRWFGNMHMTANCDVTNDTHQMQMTTTCHWMNPPMKISAYATGFGGLQKIVCLHWGSTCRKVWEPLVYTLNVGKKILWGNTSLFPSVLFSLQLGLPLQNCTKSKSLS